MSASWVGAADRLRASKLLGYAGQCHPYVPRNRFLMVYGGRDPRNHKDLTAVAGQSAHSGPHDPTRHMSHPRPVRVARDCGVARLSLTAWPTVSSDGTWPWTPAPRTRSCTSGAAASC